MGNKTKNALIEAELDLLFDRFYIGDENARIQIIENTRYLVPIIIRKFFISRCKCRDDLLELIQVGEIGLIDAVSRYDKAFGAKFTTFATPRIIGEVRDYFRRSNPVHIPLSSKNKAYAVLNELKKLNRSHTKEEFNMICKSFGYNPNTIQEIISALDISVSIENPDDHILIETGGGYSSDNLEKRLEHLDLKDSYDCLTPRELEIVRLFYYEEKTEPEIAAIFHLTQPRISQIHKVIKKKLKERLQIDNKI